MGNCLLLKRTQQEQIKGILHGDATNARFSTALTARKLGILGKPASSTVY
jgi:hypothetical protein